jgi:hypothetical protein
VRIFVDDLDGVLHACVDIAAREHLAVCASAEYLARERVHVRETRRLHVGREPPFLFPRRIVVVVHSSFVSISIRVAIAVYVLDIRNVYDRFATTTIIYNVDSNTGTFVIAVSIDQSIIVVVSVVGRAATG